MLRSMTERARCDTHGVVLTSSGACVLCERQRTAQATSSTLRKLGAAAVTLVVLAVGYRAYAMVAELRGEETRRAAMRAVAEPAGADQGSTAAAPAGAAAATTATPGETTTTAANAAGAATTTRGTARTADEAREAALENQRRVVDAQRSVSIELYGAGWCPACRQARGWLDAQGIAYTYRDTDDPTNKHTLRALNPRGTIPTINVDGRIVVGFSAENLQSTILRAAEARAAR
jgi:glutaredoxin